jgi:hypothetical protein
MLKEWQIQRLEVRLLEIGRSGIEMGEWMGFASEIRKELKGGASEQ